MSKKKKPDGADLPPQRVLQQQFDWDAAPLPAAGSILKSASGRTVGRSDGRTVG